MQPITHQDELEIIKLYARGFTQREISKKLNHGGTQVSRTLKTKNLCHHIRNLESYMDLVVLVNTKLQEQVKPIRTYILLGILIGLSVGILI